MVKIRGIVRSQNQRFEMAADYLSHYLVSQRSFSHLWVNAERQLSSSHLVVLSLSSLYLKSLSFMFEIL